MGIHICGCQCNERLKVKIDGSTRQVGGLKDLQALCVCDEDPTGTKLLPTGIPEEYSEKGSPYAENFMFRNAGLSLTDLNNKGILVFTVKWPKRSYIPFLSVHACCLV